MNETHIDNELSTHTDNHKATQNAIFRITARMADVQVRMNTTGVDNTYKHTIGQYREIVHLFFGGVASVPSEPRDEPHAADCSENQDEITPNKPNSPPRLPLVFFDVPVGFLSDTDAFSAIACGSRQRQSHQDRVGARHRRQRRNLQE